MIIIRVFPFKQMLCVRKRNVSGRCFFYAHKTIAFIDSIDRHFSLNPLCPNFISVSEYFEKSELEFLRFFLYLVAYSGVPPITTSWYTLHAQIHYGGGEVLDRLGNQWL